MDLNFDAEAKPSVFHHGIPCDCTCKLGLAGRSSICSLHDHVCKGSTDARSMMTFLAENASDYGSLAMIYVDTKTSSIRRLRSKHKSFTIAESKAAAGENVGAMLDAALFRKGYGGIVIVNAPKLEDNPYLDGVISVISQSPWEGRVFYTFDMKAGKRAQVMQTLVGLTKYRACNVGISACAPLTYYNQIKAAAADFAAGVLSVRPGIWTIDSSSSMETYLELGAGSVMSNNPGEVVALAKRKGLRLAMPGSFPPAARADASAALI